MLLGSENAASSILPRVFIALGIALSRTVCCDVIESSGSLTPQNHHNSRQAKFLSPKNEVFNRDLNCSDAGSLVCVDMKTEISGIKAIIRACPRVEKVLIRLNRRGRFKRSRLDPNIKIGRTKHEIVINHPTRRQELWITSRHMRSNRGEPRLVWSYKTTGRYGTEWKTGTQCNRKLSPRQKRSNSNDGGNSPINDTNDCGKKQSCIRFGTENCHHLECEYLLTYSIVNRTVLHLEISGKTKGWVALGLSSDNKMGGDDVIVCKRRSGKSDDLVAMSMTTNVAHAKPQPHKRNDLELTYSRMEGGFIYCKMTRILRNGVATSDSKVDLTNNWYQLYARGDMDRNGFMLKHKETPPTSLETITMLRPIRIDSLKYESLSRNSAGSNLLQSSTELSVSVFCIMIFLKITFVVP